jgi:hypothetical protein
MLLIQIAFFNPDPRSILSATVLEDVLALVSKLYLCVLLRELCRLNVHSQINFLWVARAEQFTVWSCVDEQKFPTENAICAFEQVVVVATLS